MEKEIMEKEKKENDTINTIPHLNENSSKIQLKIAKKFEEVITRESEIHKEYIVEINSSNFLLEKKNNNKIFTSKYTWYNVIPKIVLEQFSKILNIYFLIIACLQVKFLF